MEVAGGGGPGGGRQGDTMGDGSVGSCGDNARGGVAGGDVVSSALLLCLTTTLLLLPHTPALAVGCVCVSDDWHASVCVSVCVVGVSACVLGGTLWLLMRGDLGAGESSLAWASFTPCMTHTTHTHTHTHVPICPMPDTPPYTHIH